MNLAPATATKKGLRHKKAASRPGDRHAVHRPQCGRHRDPARRPLGNPCERITPPGTEALGRPERWIGPLLVAFALLEFAVAP
jgi:hypothetical protein